MENSWYEAAGIFQNIHMYDDTYELLTRNVPHVGTLYFKWKEDKWNISDKMKDWKYLIRSFISFFFFSTRQNEYFLLNYLVDGFSRLNKWIPLFNILNAALKTNY